MGWETMTGFGFLRVQMVKLPVAAPPPDVEREWREQLKALPDEGLYWAVLSVCDELRRRGLDAVVSSS